MSPAKARTNSVSPSAPACAPSQPVGTGQEPPAAGASCGECGGTGFVIVERAGGNGGTGGYTTSAAVPCTCREKPNTWIQKRVAYLSSGPELTLKAAQEFADAMGAIPFYPRAEVTIQHPDGTVEKRQSSERLCIASHLKRMCSTYRQAQYVVARATELCHDWEKCGGVRLLRQILCAMTTPKDGKMISSFSGAFPEGIPSDAPPQHRLPAPGEFRSLPRQDTRLLTAGDVSQDRDQQRELIAAAQTKEMDRKPYLITPPLMKKAKPEPISEERRREIQAQIDSLDQSKAASA